MSFNFLNLIIAITGIPTYIITLRIINEIPIPSTSVSDSAYSIRDKLVIIGVKSVSLSEFGMPYSQPMFKGNFVVAESMALSSPTPVFSYEQDVTTSVQVVFLIESN